MNQVAERSTLQVASGDFLRAPATLGQPTRHLRSVAAASTPAAAATNRDFVILQRSYRQQYSNIYFLRLHALKAAAAEAAHRQWLDNTPGTAPAVYAAKISAIPPGRRCAVVGTLYCDQKGKPNVLDDLSKELWISAPPPRVTYADGDADLYYLEDESSRVTLTGAVVRAAGLATGAVIAVLGTENLVGDFEVEAVTFPGLAPQPALPARTEDRYVALVSGLQLAGRPPSLGLELMTEFLTGCLGGPGDQALAAAVTRLVVVGNALGSESAGALELAGGDGAAGLKALDGYLSAWAALMPVDLMPGADDPANHVLPQQALHISLFPRAGRLSTFESVTNPAWFDVDGVSLLGTAGQTIDDLVKYGTATAPIDVAERSLRWRHMAPSAPDTLWCYPFAEKDPFVLESTPHVYFIGNQATFQSRLTQGSDGQVCRIVCVPDFSHTSTLVLVNLRTLAAHTVSFTATF
ncbi:DNA polymerase delta small subunit Cdc1 [Tieghemiomyces parasiticus]|uniref:DNA polymerase delta small subunit Cdc1 n=1 Tax=Tieghemiomyces parasiticus TaxID=78921 RepID=A0A9W7ZQV9_9FUNG|nr:DNA polymerase delta small subunit Cdc1 [Tieghemiomyces parasiticus]